MRHLGRRTAATAVLLLLATACAEPEVPDPLPTDGAQAPSDDAGGDEGEDGVDGNEEPTVEAVEEAGSLTLPDGATDVVVDRVEGTETLRAVFTLPSADLDAWCQEQALGPSTPMSRPPDADGRGRFGIAEDVPEDGMRRCQGSAPDDPQVQREVIATGTDGDEASVHLLVQTFPTR